MNWHCTLRCKTQLSVIAYQYKIIFIFGILLFFPSWESPNLLIIKIKTRLPSGCMPIWRFPPELYPSCLPHLPLSALTPTPSHTCPFPSLPFPNLYPSIPLCSTSYLLPTPSPPYYLPIALLSTPTPPIPTNTFLDFFFTLGSPWPTG